LYSFVLTLTALILQGNGKGAKKGNANEKSKAKAAKKGKGVKHGNNDGGANCSVQYGYDDDIVFDVRLYDYERSWKKYVKTLNAAFATATTPSSSSESSSTSSSSSSLSSSSSSSSLSSAAVTVSFAPCDVTTTLPPPSSASGADGTSDSGGGGGGDGIDSYAYAHSANSKVLVEGVNLMLFFYVCHETSAAARKDGFSFYKSLAKRASKGAVVVIADVMTHSVGEIGCMCTLNSMHASYALTHIVLTCRPYHLTVHR
jgi:hypothetical protein